MILWVLLFVGVSGLAAAVQQALFGPRAKARKRLRAAARDLTDGTVVTLTGKVVAKKQVIAGPLSGRDGVAFSARARIYRQVSTGRLGGRTIDAEIVDAMMVEFELDTKDGTVVVTDSELVVEFPPEPIIPRKLDREQQFLFDHGHNVHANGVGFDEVIIRPGMKVSVHGAVHIEAAPGESGYRETGRRVVLSAPPGHPLTIGRPV